MELEFKSYCGQQPWFFVPDTGTPGGTATLTAPDGTESTVTNTQLSPTPWAWPSLGDKFTAPRMGFEVPGVFIDPGEYVLTVTQDDAKGKKVVDKYTIDVVLDLIVLVDEGALGEMSRLNQLRTLQGHKPFDLTENATADGLTPDEVAALNKFRASRQWAALKEA
jgi:hypothetical protein